jgi:hypothetical protein
VYEETGADGRAKTFQQPRAILRMLGIQHRFYLQGPEDGPDLPILWAIDSTVDDVFDCYDFIQNNEVGMSKGDIIDESVKPFIQKLEGMLANPHEFSDDVIEKDAE